MGEFWKKITAHPFITTVIAILLFIAATWPVFVSRETIPEFLAEKGWTAVTMPPWYYTFALTLGGLVAVLQVALIRAVRGAAKRELATKDETIVRLEAQLATAGLPSSSVFEIEKVRSKLHWRQEGKQGLHPISKRPIPSDAALVLVVTARITANPSTQVEDVWLEIEGLGRQDRLTSDWRPREISTDERQVRFDLPFSISPGPYSAKLFARISPEGSEPQEKTSRSFDMYISRSYSELLE